MYDDSQEEISLVLMKRSIQVFLCIVLSFAALSARSQTAPEGKTGSFSVSAGGFGSVFQPDYANGFVAHASPNHLYGFGAYVDVRLSRWAQFESEGRWLHYNEYLGINQNSYLIGPRIPIRTFHDFTPYGKVLVGAGTGSFLTGSTLAVAYGGGVDYRVSRRFTLRCFDFEYQEWRVSPTTLYPYGGSVGLSYKVY